MADRVGQQLGNYRLVRRLGQGGFAEVYLGEHIYLETTAAIKVLHAQIASEDVAHFHHEARTIARLIHPHIVRVLEFGVEENTPFLVVDYAPNGTLRKKYGRGSRLGLPTIVSYVKQLADALQYAHEQKVVHRDVKPENMLIGRRNEILLSDFGIALVTQTVRSQTTRDMQEIAGTVAYMAPEQIQSQAGPASDQYSLAIVVYEWLCGERPFHGTFTEIAVKQTLTPPPRLLERVPTLPSRVEEVVMRALSKEPGDRFPTIEAFAAALEEAYSTVINTTPGITRTTDPLYQLSPVVVDIGEQHEQSGGGHDANGEASGDANADEESVLHTPELRDSFSSRTVPLPLENISDQGAIKDEAKSPPSGGSGKQAETSSSFRRRKLSRRSVLTGVAAAGLVAAGGVITGYAYLHNAMEASVQPAQAPDIGTTYYSYKGHSGLVWSVAWSPDGKSIASGSSDKTIQVYRASNGIPQYTYTGHSDTVYDIAWSPDSRRIASASYDKTVQVWDATSGYFPLIYTGHTSWVWPVAWSRSGQYIASGGGDRTVHIWSALDASTRYVYEGHAGYVYGLAWAPNSQRVASSSSDGSAQVWDALNGAASLAYRLNSTAIWGIAWSPDGQTIAIACNDKTVQLWDAASGNHRYTYYGHSDFVYTVAWSPDGARIASAGDDKTIHVWDPNQGSLYLTYSEHTASVRGIAWSPDGTRIASASWDRTVRVWQAV